MNTNDPAATYGKPMMTDEQCAEICLGYSYDGYLACDHVRDFYENLIHEGRLRVVEEVTYRSTWDAGCSKCGTSVMDTSDMLNQLPFDYCPGCGNPVKLKPTNQ